MPHVEDTSSVSTNPPTDGEVNSSLSAANDAANAFIGFQETINAVLHNIEHHPDIQELRTRLIVLENKVSGLTSTFARGADNNTFFDANRTDPTGQRIDPTKPQ